jgi:hypothetical protein
MSPRRWLGVISVASTLRSRSRRPDDVRRWLIGMSLAAVLSLALTVGLCVVIVNMVTRTKDDVATRYSEAVRKECPELATTVTDLEKGAPLTMAGAYEVSRRVRDIRRTPKGRARCRIDPENPLMPQPDVVALTITG